MRGSARSASRHRRRPGRRRRSRHALADGHHPAGELMAERQRRRLAAQRMRALADCERSLGVLGEVRAANAAERDLDLDHPGSEWQLELDFLQPHVAVAMPAHGLHVDDSKWRAPRLSTPASGALYRRPQGMPLLDESRSHWVPGADDSPPLRDLTVGAVLDEAAEAWPDREALVYSRLRRPRHHGALELRRAAGARARSGRQRSRPQGSSRASGSPSGRRTVPSGSRSSSAPPTPAWCSCR